MQALDYPILMDGQPESSRIFLGWELICLMVLNEKSKSLGIYFDASSNLHTMFKKNPRGY